MIQVTQKNSDFATLYSLTGDVKDINTLLVPSTRIHSLNPAHSESVSEGFALVPLRPTQEMEDVFNVEGWQWEDLLAAAGTITEEQYNFASATPESDVVSVADDSSTLLRAPDSETKDYYRGWRAGAKFGASVAATQSVEEQPVTSEPSASQASSSVNQPRGTDAQILKERELTALAISGAIEYGKNGWAAPPDDSTWLRPFYEIGVYLAAVVVTADVLPMLPQPDVLDTLCGVSAHVRNAASENVSWAQSQSVPKPVGVVDEGDEGLFVDLETAAGVMVKRGDELYTFQQAMLVRQDSFQARVQPWLLTCFGEAIAADCSERNHRFLEESLELVQACGCTRSEAHQLVDYVFGRPVGDKEQETGGAMVTLAALCLAHGLNMHAAAEIELARIWTKVEAIRAKQAAKPKHSPLTEHVDQAIHGATEGQQA